MRLGVLSSDWREIGASATIILLLSAGLGAGILLYTALDRLILHPLNIPEPETLVRAAEQQPPITMWQYFPYSSYDVIRNMHSFADVAIEGPVDTTIKTGTGLRPALALMVSPNYFSILGVPAKVGRVFGDADGMLPSGEIQVVLSHRFWTRELAGRAQVLGSSVELQGALYTVVGVMPEGFVGSMLDNNPDLWLPPNAQSRLSRKALTDPRTDRHFSVLARLKKDATIEQAQAEFNVAFQRLELAAGRPNTKRKGIIVPAAQGTFALREQFGRALTLLLSGVGMLLSMVCASVVGLMIAKATYNERDTAIRIALGASRSSLIWRLFTESAMNGMMGACGAILVASLCASPLAKLLPVGRSSLSVSLVPSWKIDFLAVLLALTISLLFGAITASFSTQVAPQSVLRDTTATKRSGNVSRALLMIETGATLVLLVGTGLLVRTLYVLRHTSPGFDVEHLISFRLNPGLENSSAQLSVAFPTELRREIEAIPGVRSASFATAPVMQRLGMKTSVARPGQKIQAEAFMNTTLDRVSPSFFSTLGIPLLSGRTFSLADSQTDQSRSGPIPTVINEAFARRLFANEDPIGRTFGMGGPGDVATETNVVVGLVADSKYRSLREPLLPIYYTPIDREPNWASQFYLYVRTQREPAPIIHSARDALARLNAGLPFSEAVTLREQVIELLWQERLVTTLAAIFCIISMLIAWAGLYGLLSYDVSQRSKEFGIRSALGAQNRNVVLLLAKDVARIILPGSALGLIVCLLAAPIISPLLYGVKPFDPISLGGALLIVLAIAMLSAWSPAHRAIHIDPAALLRKE
jgi:putative ABC transport system permease protein